MKSHRDDGCWRLAAREITSPVPGADGVMGSDPAREGQPTHLSLAEEGLRPRSWMNKQGGTLVTRTYGISQGAGMYPVPKGCYQTTANSASRLCSARHKHGGEGTDQQQGPEAGPTEGWLGSDHEAQHHAGLMPHVYLSCQVPLREAILGAGTKEGILSPPK